MIGLRNNDMVREVEERLVEDVECVVDQAQPTDAQTAQLAGRLVDSVSASMEALFAAAGTVAEAEAARSSGQLLSEDGRVAAAEVLAAAAAAAAGVEFPLTAMVNAALQWIQRPADATTERPIYTQMSAFVLLVAHLIQRELTKDGELIDRSKQLILPFRKVDTNPTGADDGTRIDVGLRCCSLSSRVEAQVDPDYLSMFAVVEAKGQATKANTMDAYAQLFDYTRNMYYNQLRLRFAWGLICCGSVVNACIFGNYKAYASPNIDVMGAEGRHEFIRLLVGWSVCGVRQLGQDESIDYDAELGYYRIKVPDSDAPDGYKVYYTDTMVMGAERLFGRHCRCFKATATKPTEKVTKDNPLKHTVIIKDSWTVFGTAPDTPEAGGGGEPASDGLGDGLGDAQQQVGGMARGIPQSSLATAWPTEQDLANVDRVDPSLLRSEVALLRKIGDALEQHEELDGLYPRLEAGGWVRQGLGDDLVLDSTREMIGGLSDEQQRDTPFCLHVRYAMTPIGTPLREVESVPELILVLYDVMQCYMFIHRECGILHRDISDNNIMLVRSATGRIRGLLIDFDCALDTLVKGRAVRPERTGTFPFMSVANLEELQIERTPLDDWELLLYLVCWLGTFGINSKNEHPGDISNLDIHKWLTGDPVDIVSRKRFAMDTSCTFENGILMSFHHEQDKDRLLYGLAQALHRKLFMNDKLDSKCHSALKGNPGADNASDDDDADDSDDVFTKLRPRKHNPEASTHTMPQGSEAAADPFAERNNHAKVISRGLMGVLKRYAEMALGCLNE
ncbi:hypothetical protein LPJ61_004835 [Coemansia biformis]|uniref:Protein kinase domain-containing protein n=1 Tax=Coemansia biformis TaxID=1286918 RepID=A0A9W7Y8R1_9FUNG|nr:hypothetical protein LPJ61_004835 [Coemansia biformis]